MNMRKISSILLVLALSVAVVGCGKGEKESKEEGRATESANHVSAQIAEDIEILSETVIGEVHKVEWASGMEYKTHIVDTYNTDNEISVVFDIDKDGSVKALSLNNADAGAEAVDTLTALVVCILNNQSLGFTDAEMQEIGDLVTGELGEVQEKPLLLETDNFNVSYRNEAVEGKDTRDLSFSVEFIK